MKKSKNEILVSAHLLPTAMIELEKLKATLADSKLSETKRKAYYIAIGLNHVNPQLINECLAKGFDLLNNTSMHGVNYANAN